ncbi:N,N'-diacetylchitobiose transport system substrate-binding protein [Hamadaea flava]|uniref:Extracellular solute-binding protein n=1 Tax=Hamadaea flava TaxID=1742688 RepID=A0ABV8M0F0_9ACTN|nr:extracellular solute-binding protein [Hamadaea flava]MCP2321717.1 N,N'-diacetylchitobiose transport system substrate-binding protein [Hamadaea flava]
MQRRIIAAAVAAATLLAAAACGSKEDSGSGKDAKGDLTVWLQVDAQTLWPKAVETATAEFNKEYPNVKVTVAYQAWADHLTKFDAAAQGGTSPDVIELGTTEMGLYMGNGAFADLTADKAEFANSGTWVKALQDSATYQDKLYGVPYYGGLRAVIYRKDILADAGITTPPTTWAELQTAVQKLSDKHKADPTFSAFFLPGQHQYGAMPFIYDAGGQVAKQGADGKWDATFSSPESVAGLKTWKALMDAGYHGDRTINDLTAFSTMVAGKAAMFYDTSGQMKKVFGKDGDAKLKDQIGSFVMPSPTKAGSPLPAFMGGSDLAIPAKGKHKDWSKSWIKAYTSPASQQMFVDGGFMANTTTIVTSDPLMKGYVDTLSNTWTLPAAKNWAQVEKNKTVLNMFVDIATNKGTIEDITAAADKAIETTLNAS